MRRVAGSQRLHPLDPLRASCHSRAVHALALSAGLLLAGALLAGCEPPAPAPPAAATPAPAPSLAPSTPATAPAPVPSAAVDAAGAPVAPADLAWPKGFVLRRSGAIGGSVAPAAWFEFAAENSGPVDAARHTLDALAAAAGPNALSDLAPAADGRSAIGQVRGPKLSAVVAASADGSGATVRVTLEPLR